MKWNRSESLDNSFQFCEGKLDMKSANQQNFAKYLVKLTLSQLFQCQGCHFLTSYTISSRVKSTFGSKIAIRCSNKALVLAIIDVLPLQFLCYCVFNEMAYL